MVVENPNGSSGRRVIHQSSIYELHGINERSDSKGPGEAGRMWCPAGMVGASGDGKPRLSRNSRPRCLPNVCQDDINVQMLFNLGRQPQKAFLS
jgi:hypothetical protein